MGKYIRKAKTRGELAVMEVSQSSLGLGVRTRARTLALQKSQHAPPSPTNSASSYLQLRSRRLHKPEERVVVKRQKHATKDDDSNHNNKQLENPSAVSKDEVKEVVADQEVKKNTDVGVEEASFGENVLELEGRERSARESTPCSLISDPDNIRTPGSTNRPTGTTETNRRTQNATMRFNIPTTQEINEFFQSVEEEQQKEFMEKYNFDPVNEKPLPGRYIWERIDP
ncbi:cyclin-dependent kinase inhibitor 5-like [Fagus crenata]|uniref:Cyclin-dependent kinase inhibitor domain-containing protein n=1 Tax=Fagus sylvatica TaxID=28930 RepID=A0A2N9GNE5_FAGSY